MKPDKSPSTFSFEVTLAEFHDDDEVPVEGETFSVLHDKRVLVDITKFFEDINLP